MIPNTPITSIGPRKTRISQPYLLEDKLQGFPCQYQANGNGIHQSVEQVDILVVFSEAIYSLVMEKLLSNK